MKKTEKKVYRIGTRTSPLALRQVEEVYENLKDIYPHIEMDTVGIDTVGDKDLTTPIFKMEGTDFFTREIDNALLSGQIDIAVHSAKDLPDELPKGLVIAAITESVDFHDVLVSKRGIKLRELPKGAKVGTSSVRIKTQLKKYREDLEIVDIRGNIGERLALLDNNERQATSDERRNIDAIVIAAAGLIRLGFEDRITERLPFDIIQPHSLQGALAIIVRKGDSELLDILNVLDKDAGRTD